MPSSHEILDGLEAIANEWRALAIAWHAVWAVALMALGAGWRPRRPVAGAALAVPILSVSLLAWLSGNPFNGTVFAILAVALAGLALRLPCRPVQISPAWLLLPGLVLTAFAWIYPHFLRTDSWIISLSAAPLGLIPCPTLSAVLGMALMLRGLDSRQWSLVLAAAGILYGLIGWARLGVAIDAVLLVGAAGLAVAAVWRPGHTRGGD